MTRPRNTHGLANTQCITSPNVLTFNGNCLLLFGTSLFCMFITNYTNVGICRYMYMSGTSESEWLLHTVYIPAQHGWLSWETVIGPRFESPVALILSLTGFKKMLNSSMPLGQVALKFDFWASFSLLLYDLVGRWLAWALAHWASENEKLLS